ncbi:MAG: pilus assembly protein [Deltaproteobacteria bacterium]|nr:pilus assembly protein [Deltaproteobacteria bacterium]
MRALAHRLTRNEEGSALTEAAILFPVLILILWWSSAMTDIMVIKLKAHEAARFALWEMTVFRDPNAISTDVQNRFRDMRSPESVNNTGTGLLMYPQAANITWAAAIDPKAKEKALGGVYKAPSTDSWLLNFVNQVLNLLSRSVDTAVRNERFNTYGYAEARIQLVRASHKGSTILNGGDLVGGLHKNDLGLPGSIATLVMSSPGPTESPQRLIFDSWKAWPKPAAYTTNGAKTNTGATPQQTYPTVEQQVSAQVQNITFFGLTRLSWFNSIRNALGKLSTAGITQTLLGGEIPDMFSSNPLDNPGGGKARGPISILPVEQPTESWAVKSPNGMTHRMGDTGGTGASAVTSDEMLEMSGGADRSRYTVPYRVHTQWWTADGGTSRTSGAFGNRLSAPPAAITTTNDYVKTFQCRGHFFAGGISGQITDVTKRYKPSCNL